MIPVRYNQTFVDIWTPVHAGSGFLAGVAGVQPVTWSAVMIGFEVFEQALEARAKKGPETAINVLGDLAVGLGFYVLGCQARKAWRL